MRDREHPGVVILAGPNGSGKSTTAPFLLKGALGVTEFVNADVIAQGLSAFNPLAQALEAGRIVHARLRQLAASGVSFAFETTLASRSLAPWLEELRRTGYHIHLVFLWLPSADAAVARVAQRVRAGGHDVPEETIRRRYAAGLRNLFRLYQPLSESWIVYDNSRPERPEIVAEGRGAKVTLVASDGKWRKVKRGAAT
jgi:predicted ABC-type ATPase